MRMRGSLSAVSMKTRLAASRGRMPRLTIAGAVMRSIRDGVADGVAIQEVDEGNGAAALRDSREGETLAEFVQHDARDVRQVEAARIVEREPVQALQFAGAADLRGVAFDRFGIGDEEARVEAARAIGRGDGAGDEI